MKNAPGFEKGNRGGYFLVSEFQIVKRSYFPELKFAGHLKKPEPYRSYQKSVFHMEAFSDVPEEFYSSDRIGHKVPRLSDIFGVL